MLRVYTPYLTDLSASGKHKIGKDSFFLTGLILLQQPLPLMPDLSASGKLPIFGPVGKCRSNGKLEFCGWLEGKCMKPTVNRTLTSHDFPAVASLVSVKLKNP